MTRAGHNLQEPVRLFNEALRVDVDSLEVYWQTRNYVLGGAVEFWVRRCSGRRRDPLTSLVHLVSATASGLESSKLLLDDGKSLGFVCFAGVGLRRATARRVVLHTVSSTIVGLGSL